MSPMPTRRAVIAAAPLAAATLAFPAALAQGVAAEPTGLAPQVPALTPALTRFIASARTLPIPDPIRDKTRLHILDTVASTVACRDLEAAQVARRLGKANGSGKFRAMGTRGRFAMVDAATIGAMTGNAAEINDFIPSAFVQPGPALLATGLTVAQQTGSSGEELLRAMLVGYEMSARIPKALGLEGMTEAGISSHAVGPLFGCAATAAVLMKLDAAQIGHMLALAAQLANGSMQWLLDVEHTEKTLVFCGIPARNGLTAALMAATGWTATRDAHDVEGGWMRSAPFTRGDWTGRRRAMVADLGERWEIDKAAFKRYPVGGPTQPGVAGVLQLRPRIAGRAVKAMTIAMPGRAAVFDSAQMPALNLRYTAALVLIDGKLDFHDVQSRERFLNDARVRALMERIRVVHDPAQEVAPPAPREESARITIDLEDGERLETFVPYVLGYPSHPMGRADVEEKVRELLAQAGAARPEAIIRIAGQPDALSRAADLLDLMG